MAELPVEDRRRVCRGLMRWWSRRWEELSGAISKQDLLDAVNATDTWIETNQASFNQALPVTARTVLTMAQKTLLFCAVAMARVSIATLKNLFGEVD